MNMDQKTKDNMTDLTEVVTNTPQTNPAPAVFSGQVTDKDNNIVTLGN